MGPGTTSGSIMDFEDSFKPSFRRITRMTPSIASPTR